MRSLIFHRSLRVLLSHLAGETPILPTMEVEMEVIVGLLIIAATFQNKYLFI
jgi:hypothetical protein